MTTIGQLALSYHLATDLCTETDSQGLLLAAGSNSVRGEENEDASKKKRSRKVLVRRRGRQECQSEEKNRKLVKE